MYSYQGRKHNKLSNTSGLFVYQYGHVLKNASEESSAINDPCIFEMI